MNKQAIWAIAKKDIRGITSNSQVWIGFIVTPLLFCILLPAGLILAAKYMDVTDQNLSAILYKILKNLPNGKLKHSIQMLPSINHQILFVGINFFLGSLFLMVPCLNSMMIATNSFVGEKERRTLESLLFAPITVKDLFIGKVLAAFIPVMALTAGSFIIFVIVADALTYSMFEKLLLPNTNWFLLIFWLSPIISLLTILFSVMVSAKVQSFQAAQQFGGVIILPIILLIVSQSSGLLILQPLAVFLIGIGLLVVCLLLLRQITKWNNRSILFEKQV